MKTEHILDVMGGIDPALVEEIGLTGKKKRRLSAPLRAGLIAACVCLVLLGSAFAADAIWGVRIANFIGQGEQTGYQVFVDAAQRVPLDSLPQAVLDLPRNEIMEFGGVEEAEALLGMSLPGFAPFQGLEKTNMHFGFLRADSEPDSNEFNEEDYDYYHTHCYLDKAGPNADGSEPNIISVTAEYVQKIVMRREGISSPDQQVIFFEVTANLITESMPYSAFGGLLIKGGSIQMEQSSFIASDGQEVPLVSIVMPVTEKSDDGETKLNLTGACAYYVQEGVIYSVAAHGWRMEDGQSVQMTAEILQGALEDLLTSFQPIGS